MQPAQPASQQAQPDTAAAATPTDPAPISGRCKFYVAKRRRFCSSAAKAGHEYCGNHLFSATGAGGVRVPCPANPKHDVPVSQLATHLPKCPDAVYQAAMRAQPYFHENLNAGADEQYGPAQLQDRAAAADAAAAAGEPAKPPPAVAAASDSAETSQDATAAATAAAAAAAREMGLVPSGPNAAAVAAVAAEAAASFLKGTAIERQAAAVALGPEGFRELLAKIDKAHAVLTAAHPLQSRQLSSAAEADALRERCLAFDKLMVFDAKHAVQNASIVGNLADAGLLQAPGHSVFLELGAGKAWLSAWLHMLHPDSNEFVLLDKLGNFNNKADRRLRHLNLTRVAIDLKDAALLPLIQLHLGATPATATTSSGAGHDCSVSTASSSNQTSSGGSGKGAAPEMEGGLIRLRGRINKRQKTGAVAAAAAAAAGSAAGPQAAAGAEGRSSAAAAAADEAEENRQQKGQHAASTAPEQQQQQQQVVPWVVLGKHLCGAATDFALRACYNALTQHQHQQQQQQQQQHFPLQGLAIASCCHHRCGWMAYTGKEALQAAGGITKQDFDIIAWLTGWALCGHESAPGTCTGQAAAAAAAAAVAGDSPGSNTQPAAAAASPRAANAAGSAKAAAASHPCNCCGTDGNSTAQPVPAADPQQQQQQQQKGRPCGWHPAAALTPQQRIQLGLKCKQLIDAGRCAWMQQHLAPLVQQVQEQQQGRMQQQGQGQQQVEEAQEQQQQGAAVVDASSSQSSGLCVRRCVYVEESVSGENTLLLLAPQP